MVNVDEKTFFETIEKRAPDAVAFEQDDGAVPGEVCGDRVGLNDAIGERKVLIDTRNAVVHDDFGVLAHHAQDLAAGQGRAYAVPIGPSVRGHHKTAACANFL